MESNKALLECTGLSFSYHTPKGEITALNNISFSVEQGEFIAIVGPSGCGKSTLLSLICGLTEPESGSLKFNGHNIHDSDTHIGYMLQKDHLFEWRTIEKNVLLGLEIQGLLNEDTRKKGSSMLSAYGLKSFEDMYPNALSGGMRQRAALIRTLILEPDLLLLDEPFSALDYQTRLEVGDEIGTILRSHEKTAILVTHDLSEAISMADRILVLSKRPASLKSIVSVSFPPEYDTPMKRRNSEDFASYFNKLWKEMKSNEN